MAVVVEVYYKLEYKYTQNAVGLHVTCSEFPFGRVIIWTTFCLDELTLGRHLFGRHDPSLF
jgi:hypothetical protein